MKHFWRVLMLVAPILIAWAFYAGKTGSLKPGAAGGYGELRSMEFNRGLNLERSPTPRKNIDGGLGVFYRKGFIGFDFGNLRIAIRNSNPAYLKYANSPRGSGQAALVVSPPRIPKPAPTFAPPRGMPYLIPSELPEGTRVICDGKVFDFVNGEVVIGGRRFSAIDGKPTLVVLDASHKIEHSGPLPLSRFPPPERSRPIR
ncbi:MAG: hypothetical protein HKN23_18545 [Verrucomicrobiales bacterium]|nr:hypothetical protein [Verrucomicrobiales bacterium]